MKMPVSMHFRYIMPICAQQYFHAGRAKRNPPPQTPQIFIQAATPFHAMMRSQLRPLAAHAAIELGISRRRQLSYV